jgi:drug/metabolite transporter (DMT)-like permease
VSTHFAGGPAPLRQHSPSRGDRPNYHAGAYYALATAALIALQEPFSALAAQKLTSLDFVAFTQVALLISLPLLLASSEARHDFAAILTTARNWPKLIALFAVGCMGLLLYDVALSSAHPIITAAVLNLSPFWAALVAKFVSGKNIPRPTIVFVTCFAFAFAGAMIVALSQINEDSSTLKRDLLYGLFHSRWALALPMPLFFALSGTLVYKWFGDYDESAAIASNFIISAVVLVPATLFLAHGLVLPALTRADAPAIFLLLIGTLASSAAGRLFYQVALTATHNDNGFVTMFFLAIPGISAIITLPLSLWISELRLHSSLLFWEGILLVMAPLVIFSNVTARMSQYELEPAKAPEYDAPPP